MRIPPGIARIPLWKRDIPKYPLYYKGDPKPKIILPLFWMKVIPPEQKIPPNYVHFQVHPQMSKLDVKQYLEKIYKVPVLSVRTELRKRAVEAYVKQNNRLSNFRGKVTTEEDKYAYVQLRDVTFQYPDYFEKGGKSSMAEKEDETLKINKEKQRQVYRPSPNQGIPTWFRHSKKEKL